MSGYLQTGDNGGSASGWRCPGTLNRLGGGTAIILVYVAVIVRKQITSKPV